MVPLEELTLPILVGAALLDSINPCVFGVLIFLIVFMLRVFKEPRQMLIGGVIYTAAVYVTYLLIGVGFLGFTTTYGLSQTVYWLAALIAIAAGLLEIKDFFWYGRWFSLEIIPGAARLIQYCAKRISFLNQQDVWLSYLAAGLFGIFAVAAELPCTGAPYLAVLAILGEGDYVRGLPLLLLYNSIFILPLLAIIGAAYLGKSSKALESWRRKYRHLMRLAAGLFLTALGGYMLYNVW